MGPPQSIPKKGKSAAVVAPMSEDEGGHSRGQSVDANIDVDAEMNDIENGEEADVNESQGEEDEGDEDEEEEDQDIVDQMAMEVETVHRDSEGLDLSNQLADRDEDI